MFGALRPTSLVSSGLLWKNPWRLSATRKANQRKRLRRVDDVISMVSESGVVTKSLVKALELPTEAEMPPKGESVFESQVGKGDLSRGEHETAVKSTGNVFGGWC
ncbi:50S small subunit ribosomal protein L31 [Cryptococcus wingfieldii CBS 7118]|uniref:50S small subunit ribosomal protein L31 n=1 Tax=Cryptococcus wingfieldii CBS 7118 TaxID=1295528 RepID=A0A1E3J482_9TREE|nr:50S small subunit ribosomal protein L31 [Cryptococcus wingfieldii CBS 7118]ODN94771.1 50S small subunit ribosomal protein L31 [Cryptococcus wingfieldii CBS 7118]